MKLLTSGVRALSQVYFTKRLPTIAPCSLRFKSHNTENPEIKHTRLHNFHVAKGGKMVDFAGWRLPVQYSNLSVGASHLYTRDNGSLFDVSHMLQTRIYGVDRVEFFESLTVGDVAGLKDNQSLLSVFTNEDGGILDDLVVTKTSNGYLYVVSNAGRAEKDLHHMRAECEDFKARGKDVRIEVLDNALLAVQGPKVAEALQPHVNTDLSDFYFMTSRIVTLFDVPEVRMTRCGYTGEDGFELSVPADNVVYIAERLLEVDNEVIKLAGLGARDSLRLEAGLCLYGSDIDEKRTPVEAGLTWTIGKRRRELENFPGAQIIMKQLRDKPHQKRVGIISEGAPARADTPIYDSHGTSLIGKVTSGCPSPSLNKNVAIGYVDIEHANVGQHVKLEVRKHQVEGSIVKMPFLPTKYYTEKKA